MLPLGAAVAILGQAPWIGDAELPRQFAADAWWHIGGIIKKSAKKSHCAKLDGIAEPHRVRALCAGEVAIGVVEVKMAGKLVGCGLACVPAVAPFLFGGQERDRHALSDRGVWLRVTSVDPRRRHRHKAC